MTFSVRRHLFIVPNPPVKCHTDGVGSFIMRGKLKALHTHVHHSSTPASKPWSSRCRRPLVRQRQEQFCCCSLIYNCPFLRCQAHLPAYPASTPPSKPVHPHMEGSERSLIGSAYCRLNILYHVFANFTIRD